MMQEIKEFEGSKTFNINLKYEHITYLERGIRISISVAKLKLEEL